MKTFSKGDINIVELEQGDKLTPNLTPKASLLFFPNELSVESLPVNNTIYKYPENISYKISVSNNLDSYLSTFKSTTRRVIKKRYTNIQDKYNVKIIENLDKALLTNWYEGYKHFIENKQFGENKIKDLDEWFLKDRGEEKFFGIFIYDKNDSVLYGGQIIKTIPSEFKYSLSYSWFNDNLRNEGASTFIIISLYELALKNNVRYISFGRDTNLYGGSLPISLLDFKLSWKSTPYIPRNTRVINLVKINDLPNQIKFYYINELGLLDLAVL